jgi:diguanylate cyclase (GGDEF)-like protein/PAS domain S-box-containing protein
MFEDGRPVPAPVKGAHLAVLLAPGAVGLGLLWHVGGWAALAIASGFGLPIAGAAIWLVLRERTRLVQRSDQLAVRQRLADAVFANSGEAMLITDARACILAVNAAFERITGHAEHEVLGQNPRLQSSGRQDPAFYQAMWAGLIERGVWQGEIWNRRKSGEIYAVWQTITAVRDNAGLTTHYVSLFSDITPIKENEERLRYLAYHDPLTGLSNRLLFRNSLDQSLARTKRHERKLALMYLDLDHFKVVNDTIGHAGGDALLEEIARRLRGSTRAQDVVARLGGDEFIMLIEDVEDRHEIAQLADKLLGIISQPVFVEGRTLSPSASVGIALFPDDAATADELMQAADEALYDAKDAGRRTYRFHTDSPGLQEGQLPS